MYNVQMPFETYKRSFSVEGMATYIVYFHFSICDRALDKLAYTSLTSHDVFRHSPILYFFALCSLNYFLHSHLSVYLGSASLSNHSPVIN